MTQDKESPTDEEWAKEKFFDDVEVHFRQLDDEAARKAAPGEYERCKFYRTGAEKGVLLERLGVPTAEPDDEVPT